MISILKYFSNDISVSKFKLIREQKLIVFLLADQEFWRCHEDQLYHYEDGSWNKTNLLSFEDHTLLVALAGIFIEMSDKKDLIFKWEGVSEKL